MKSGNSNGGSVGIFDSPGLGGQHTSAIAQVEPLGEADWSVSAAASQFASVDVEGVVILWMSSAVTPTTLAHREGSENTTSKTQLTYITSSTPSSSVGTNGIPISDLTRSISGTVTLLQLKVIRRDSGGGLFSQPSFSPAASALSRANSRNNNLSNNLLNKCFDLSLASETAVLATVPSDLSLLLLSEPHGKVAKITRFGEPSAPKRFYRPESDRIEVAVQGVVASRHFNRDIINSALGTGEDLDFDGRGEGKHELVREKSALLLGDKKIDFFSSVTCMSVRPNVVHTGGVSSSSSSSSSSLGRNGEGKSEEKEGKDSEDHKDERGDESNTTRRENTTTHPPLLLIGRADGTLDLYRMDACEPLQTWTLSDHFQRTESNSNNGSPSRGNRPVLSKAVGSDTVSVVGVKWVPTRASAFVAVDNAGRCFYFDLLVNHYKPLHVEHLNCIYLRGGLRMGNTDLSCCRPNSRVAYLAVGNSTPLSGSGGSSASARIGVVVRRLAEDIVGGRDKNKGTTGGKPTTIHNSSQTSSFPLIIHPKTNH